jgi:hypothetical protein
MRRAATLLILCALSSGTQAQTGQAQGFVFEDRNHNGSLDAGEPGVPGVAVSNGIDVLQTQDDGRYTIPLPEESILFISKPASYRVPVNDQNLPQFYYIHYPNGTSPVAQFQFPVIEPTGPLPAAINFPLYRGEDRTRFDALAFADPQTSDDEELDFMREDVVAELVGTEDAYSPPKPSSHLWEFVLPGDLASGVHTVTVRSTDQFGQASEDSLPFEIVQ